MSQLKKNEPIFIVNEKKKAHRVLRHTFFFVTATGFKPVTG